MSLTSSKPHTCDTHFLLVTDTISGLAEVSLVGGQKPACFLKGSNGTTNNYTQMP